MGLFFFATSVFSQDQGDFSRLSNGEFYLHVRNQPQHGPGCRIWEKIDLTLENDEKAVVLPMVAQISIIDEVTPNETKRILAFVSCVSSIIILNVFGEIESKDLVAAEEILRFSSLHRQDPQLMICIQRYVQEEEDANEYFRNLIKDDVDGKKNLRQIKRFLRESDVKCFGFPNSNFCRDPAKLPDLDVQFLQKVTDFIVRQVKRAGNGILQISNGTGHEIFRYFEELDLKVGVENVARVVPTVFGEVIKRTRNMLECEAAYADLLRQASCNTLESEAELNALKEKAETAATEKAHSLGLNLDYLRRIMDKNGKLFEHFQTAGVQIRNVVRSLDLKRQDGSSSDEGAHVQDGEVIREDVDHISESPSADSKRSPKAKRSKNGPKREVKK